MKLSLLLDGLVDIVGALEVPDIDITYVSVDSRQVKPGVVFVACPGALPTSKNGHEFIAQAIESGASAIVIDKD